MVTLVRPFVHFTFPFVRLGKRYQTYEQYAANWQCHGGGPACRLPNFHYQPPTDHHIHDCNHYGEATVYRWIWEAHIYFQANCPRPPTLSHPFLWRACILGCGGTLLTAKPLQMDKSWCYIQACPWRISHAANIAMANIDWFTGLMLA